MLKCVLFISTILVYINEGETLSCYSCNVTTSKLDTDACKGIGTTKPCSANSVCLSALYNLNIGTIRSHIIMKSCFPHMAGEECTNFMKTQKNLVLNPSTLKLESCETCETDDCNRQSSSGAVNLCNVVILSILSYVCLNLF